MIEKIPLHKIECLEQVRGDVNRDIDGLAQSIREVGLLQPVSVRREGDRIITVDGARRCAAAERAGLDSIEVDITDRTLTEAEVTLRQLVANAQRVDLTPLETADALFRIKELYRCGISELASKAGFTVTKVSNLLALRSLPHEILSRVESGELSASSAVELARIENPTHQQRIADEAAAEGLTRDAVACKVRAARRNRECGASAGLKRATAVLGSGHMVTVSGSDLTLDRFIECLEEVLIRSRRARNKGIGLSAFLKSIRDQEKA